MTKALIAMSGGVDSSVTAYLMKEQGYDCIGVTFQMFDKTDPLFGFSGNDPQQELRDAEAVCKKVGIPFLAVDASEEFRKYVIHNFIRTYEKGGTPNPCVACNRHVKFELLNRLADEYGCDVVATGHYAKTGYDETTDRYYIAKADDPKKDQSYVLYSLRQEQLRKVRFPLAGITKEEARSIAEKNGFVNAHKSDSQDICFIPDGAYAEFILRTTGKQYSFGKFVDTAGHPLGQHKGMIHYTIGQRRGLGVALGEPMYVKTKNMQNNTVVLARDEELYEQEVLLEKFNFLALPNLDKPLRCRVRLRYKQPEKPATVCINPDNTVRIIFDEPQRAPAKGQSAVLYDGDIVLGGGIIL